MRIWIIGAPGSGKSVVADKLAAYFNINHHELDYDFWLKTWQIRPLDEFIERVKKKTEPIDWVMDGNYVSTAPILLKRAELLLWLDIPFWVSYSRILYRTWRRIITQQEFWEGNRETWRNTFRKDGMPCYALFKHRRNYKRFTQYWNSFTGPKLRLTKHTSAITDAINACNELRRGTYHNSK